jgi:hypothetical protein
VASRTEGCVDEEAPALWRERVHDLVEENGCVRRGFNRCNPLGSRFTIHVHSSNFESSS